MNKKGIMPIAAVMVLVIVVSLIGVLFAKGVFAQNTLPSLTPKSPNYDERSCPNLGVNMVGHINVFDSAVFDLEPSVQEVSIDQVKVNGRSLQFGTEPFTYEVKAFRTDTNSKVGSTFRGTGLLRDTDNSGINKEYSIFFEVPDQDCNKRLDDFNVNVVAELQGADIGDIPEQSTLIKFQGGAIVR